MIAMEWSLTAAATVDSLQFTTDMSPNRDMTVHVAIISEDLNGD
jgi:hypothetical protein